MHSDDSDDGVPTEVLPVELGKQNSKAGEPQKYSHNVTTSPKNVKSPTSGPSGGMRSPRSKVPHVPIPASPSGISDRISTQRSAFLSSARTGRSEADQIDKEAMEAVKKNLMISKPRHPILRILLSLRLLLAAFCIVTIVIASVLAWYLTYAAGIDAIQTSAESFELQIIPRIRDTIQGRVYRAERMVYITKMNFKSGLYNLNDTMHYINNFWTQLHATQFSSDITFTSKTGGLYGPFIQPDGAYTSVWLYDETNQNQTEWFTDADGNITSLSWWAITDNTQGQWYLIVNQSDPTFSGWTPQYLWFNRFWLTYSVGVYLADGTFIGVACADMELGFMNSILDSLQLSSGYAIYVVDAATEQVVAAYPKLNLIKCVGGTGENCDGGTQEQADFKELNDPKVIGIYSSVLSTFGKWIYLKDGITSIDVQGVAYYCTYSELIESSIHWVVVETIDKNVLFGSMQSRTKTVLGIVFGIIGGTLLLSIVFAMVIAYPLQKLGKAMWMLATLDASALVENDPAERKIPMISEMREMHLTFYSMRRAIMAFSKYVPRKLVQQLLTQSSSVALGMDTVVVTVMFLDIADFTKLCEKVKPSVLVRMMNTYLGAVVGAVHTTGGTVDKFIGDAVMAFWGAPQPVKDDPKVACECVVRIIQLLEIMNQEWEAENLPTLNIRAGLHQGKVLVGNIGCEERLNYTCLGDGVNLASRLEGLGKVYGVRSIVSHSVFHASADAFLFNILDTVIVKGKSLETNVYELVCELDLATNVQKEFSSHLKHCHNLIKGKKFQQLVDYIDNLAKQGIKHGTLRVLQERAHNNIHNGTADTINVLHSK